MVGRRAARHFATLTRGARHSAHRRRGAHRLRPHRPAVRLRARRHLAGSHVPVEGNHRRLSCRSARRWRRTRCSTRFDPTIVARRSFTDTHTRRTRLPAPPALASLALLDDAVGERRRRDRAVAPRGGASVSRRSPASRTFACSAPCSRSSSTSRDAGYLSDVGPALRRFALERGVLLRPLGNTVYVLPPYCSTDDDLARAYDVDRRIRRRRARDSAWRHRDRYRRRQDGRRLRARRGARAARAARRRDEADRDRRRARRSDARRRSTRARRRRRASARDRSRRSRFPIRSRRSSPRVAPARRSTSTRSTTPCAQRRVDARCADRRRRGRTARSDHRATSRSTRFRALVARASIIVAANRLGVINHVRLTLRRRARRRADASAPSCSIDSTPSAADASVADNARVIARARDDVPVVELPWIADLDDLDVIADRRRAQRAGRAGRAAPSRRTSV